MKLIYPLIFKIKNRYLHSTKEYDIGSSSGSIYLVSSPTTAQLHIKKPLSSGHGPYIKRSMREYENCNIERLPV